MTASPLREDTVSNVYPSSKLTTPVVSRDSHHSSATIEPEIIWSVPITHPTKIKTKLPHMKQPLTNDDTLIIGIVGAVVAFILILIIVICIVRLRMSSNMVQMPQAASVQLSYKTAPTIYTPQYAAQYAAQYATQYATLPHHKMSMSSQTSIAAQNYSQNTLNLPPNHPYYVYQDDKNYR